MIHKQVLPESFDFGMPSVELVGVGSKGLDKTAMVKRASAFDDVLEKIEKKANREYLHVITTGAYEKYGPNRNCFVAGTGVTTDHGVVPIENIQVGDRVLTASGRYETVVRTMVRLYKGPMVALKVLGLGEPVNMTADHPVQLLSRVDHMYHYYRLHKGRETRADYERALQAAVAFKDADTLQKYDYVRIPERKTEDYAICGLQDPKTRMLHAKACGVDKTDTLYAYVLGLWLAEGCVYLRAKEETQQKRRSESAYRRGSVIFTLNPDKDANSIEVLEAFAEKAGHALHVSETQSKVAKNYEISSTELALDFIRLLGRGAHNKYIDPVLFNMPDAWKLYFVAGYLDGDGCQATSGKERGKIAASTVSKSLAVDLQAFLSTLGVNAKVTKCCNREKNGCFGRGDNPIYQILICASQADILLPYSQRFDKSLTYAADKQVASKNMLIGHDLFMQVSKVTKYEQTEEIPVYNLEVSNDHTFCVPFVVHNCDAWNGHSFDMDIPYPEDGKTASVKLDGGLSKYHDDTYMKDGAVYQEHQTKRAGVEPSGEIVCARYNPVMERGELIIAVDTNKWAPRLQKKAQGKDIYLSIGADVDRDICMLCGRQAKTASQHCDHFTKHRMQVYDCGKVACVMNDAPHFYDISGVDVPADRIAFVLQKVASGATTKEASLEAILTMDTRKPIVITKSAAILSKLSKMEKELQGLIEGDKDDAVFEDADDAKGDFLLRVENYPSDEIVDSCNRKGILLSPEMLFKILGKDCENEEDRAILCSCDDSSCGDCSCMMQELEDDEDKNSILLDGSFDQHLPADLNLDDILEQFIPEFGASNPAIQAKVIRITITGREPKKSQKKEASFNKYAQEALRRTYARYLISFAEQNDDATCMNALRKIATYGK